MSDVIASLRKQLQQLKAQHEQGKLDAAAYAAAAAPLERQLIDQMVATPASAAPGAQLGRPSKGLVLGLCTAVVAVALAGYGYTGSPGMTVLDPQAMTAGAQAAAQAAAGASEGDDVQRFAQVVEQLAQRLKDQPDNAEGWAMLARSYARLDSHAQALPAYEQAIRLNPKDASLHADMADTVAVQNNGDLEGRPLQLLEQALKLDPDNAKALALIGTAAFNRKDYRLAVSHWEKLQSLTPGDSALLPQLQGSIAQARSMAGMPVVAGAAAGAAAAPAAPPAMAASAVARLSGTVRLSPALAAQAGPDDTVFIFARPAEGARMPVAILRKQVKDLPLSFTLDDTLAMAPEAKLSLFPQVVVSARISRSGQAAPTAGDLTGQSAVVANTASGLAIEINEVVKP